MYLASVMRVCVCRNAARSLSILTDFLKHGTVGVMVIPPGSDCAPDVVPS
jgi:hypothetical protein